MKNTKFVIIFVGFIILGFSVMWFYGTGEVDNVINRVIPGTKVDNSCEIENCHGLDITCGSDKPDFCTMIYELGDRCRQFASCRIVNGECQLVKSDRFEKCKSCVKKCIEDYRGNPIGITQCEASCAN